MNRATFNAQIAELRALAADKPTHDRYLEALLSWQERGGEGDGPDRTGPALSHRAASALEDDVLALYSMQRNPDLFVAYGRDYPRFRDSSRLAAIRRQAANDLAGDLAKLLRLDG